ncbi:hypothetical protein [Mycobacterium sp.]|uniref:hypothetical protein n=1 Tax=Mycobacterium sp. TaxID=1785 RepID=UPI003D0A1A58
MKHFEVDGVDSEFGADSKCARLSRSLGAMDCTVAVIADDVADIVHSAGGWIFDRVRAGWRVSAWTTSPCDLTPLVILGVRPTSIYTSWLAELSEAQPASLAIQSDLLAPESPLNIEVQELMRCPTTEVTVWGDGKLLSERQFQPVQHTLSPAARRFKKHALERVERSPATDETEYFRCRAPWYPLDGGADLQQVSADQPTIVQAN